MSKTLVRILLVLVLAIPPTAIGIIYVIAKREQAAKLAEWEGVDPATVPRATAAAQITGGGYVYQQHCATCHGPDGQGGLGKALNHPGLVGDAGHAYIMTVLANGVEGTPMTSWRGVLGPHEAAAVAAYVQTFPTVAPAAAAAADQ